MYHLLTCKQEESLIIYQHIVPVVNMRDGCKGLVLYSSLAVLPGYRDMVARKKRKGRGRGRGKNRKTKPKAELESIADKPE